jgi:hypothetical protein
MTDKARKKCFVVSPIGGEGTAERRHADMLLHGVILPVLEDKFDVRRADGFSSPDIITARIIDCIVNWDLVVADLSFSNPNVFYEVGLRHMVAKPIIHMAAADTKLPFDTAAQRTIFFDPYDWHSQEKARQALAAAAKDVGEPEYTVSNPVTHALGVISARADADPQSKLVASLEERLARMESTLRTATRSEFDHDDPNRLRRFWSFVRMASAGKGRFDVDLLVNFVNDRLLGLTGDEAQKIYDSIPKDLPKNIRSVVEDFLYEKYDVIPF